jgi:hypothetical protein
MPTCCTWVLLIFKGLGIGSTYVTNSKPTFILCPSNKAITKAQKMKKMKKNLLIKNKSKKLNYTLCLLFVTILLLGCSTSNLYQVYDTQIDSPNIIVTNNYVVYEDDNCMIYYDFWSQNGNSSFSFYNKTDKMIYVDLSESFFIQNGIANDYFQNRVYSNSSNTYVNKSGSIVTSFTNSNMAVGFGSSATTTNGYSVSNVEKSVICIPPKTSKNISGFKLQESLYNSCYIKLYPTKKEKKEGMNINLFNNKSSSPLTFSNLISYSFDKDIKDVKRIENVFHVNKIGCYWEEDITDKEYIKDSCTNLQKFDAPLQKYFKEEIVKPNNFYIKYYADTSIKQ